MLKKFYTLTVLCVIAVYSSIPHSASCLKHNTKENGLYYEEYNGYWLSYPDNECLKCNCSLNATLTNEVDVSLDNGETYIHFITMFMNKSNCHGQDSSGGGCYCYGNPDFLIGQTVYNGVQFNGTMGDSTCFGVMYRNGAFTLTCQGQKRSETMILEILK